MKIDRLVGMIMILLDKERIGAKELAKLFEVSPRTIYRDMDAIAMAGIPVRATVGVGGGFEIMKKYKVDRTVFSTADLSALLMGLSGLSGMMRGDDLANALAKVRSFIPAEKARDIELRANQICIDLSPWMGSRKTQRTLEIIKTALQQGRLLAFDYSDRHGNRTERTAEPHQLVLKGGQWYWQGYCHERIDFRLFKLSRMSNLQILKETFTPRAFWQPTLDFEGILETMQTEIKLHIHESLLDRVLEFCPEDAVSPDGERHRTVRFPFIENDYHYGILLGFGDRCECMEPPHVREEVKRRVRNLAAMYGE